jgi:AcrR family transcriptional regulator
MTSSRHTPSRDHRSSAARDHDLADAVLDAARDSILAVGWRRTTLTDVARRAGVSRMTIYRRWPDTQTLLADLLVREWDAVLSATPLASTGEVTAHTLAASVSAVVRALREEPLFARIVDVDPELLLPYLLHRRGRNQDHLLALLTEGITVGQQRGTVRAGDPGLVARALLLAAQGFLVSAPTMSDEQVSTEALDAELMHIIERHLAP